MPLGAQNSVTNVTAHDVSRGLIRERLLDLTRLCASKSSFRRQLDDVMPHQLLNSALV